MALGIVLMLGSVLGFAAIAATLGDRTPVLAVARSVPAGQVIQGSDLRQVSAAEVEGLGLIPASHAADVVGRTAAVPLVPGVLLTRALVGAAVFPPAGQMAASLALKPGQFPASITIGAAVAVFLNPTTANGATNSGPTRVPATVLAVDPAGDGQGATVISLLLASADGSQVASTPATHVVIMQVTPGGN